MYVKDLSIINRDLRDVIIVDNYTYSYMNNSTNGIPIKTWVGDPADRELEKIWTVVERLNEVDDVRDFIPKFVLGEKISLYQLMKTIAPPVEDSPIKGIIDSFKDFKKGAAAFFGLPERDSTADNSNNTNYEKDSNSTSYNQESNSTSTEEDQDENTDRSSDLKRKIKISSPSLSMNFTKPNFDSNIYVSLISVDFLFLPYLIIQHVNSINYAKCTNYYLEA
jgi:hypothetical protein